MDQSTAQAFAKPTLITLNEFDLMSKSSIDTISVALFLNGFGIDFQAMCTVAAACSSENSEYLDFIIEYNPRKLNGT